MIKTIATVFCEPALCQAWCSVLEIEHVTLVLANIKSASLTSTEVSVA